MQIYIYYLLLLLCFLNAWSFNDKSIFESRENVTVRDTILCPAVCISDVMNAACMCDKSIRYLTIQLYYICAEKFAFCLASDIKLQEHK